MPKEDAGDRMRKAVTDLATGAPVMRAGKAMADAGQLMLDTVEDVKRAVAPLLPGAGPKRPQRTTDIELPKDTRAKKR